MYIYPTLFIVYLFSGHTHTHKWLLLTDPKNMSGDVKVHI